MTAALLMGPEELAAIKDAVAKARANPIPWEVLQRLMEVDKVTRRVSNEERERAHAIRPPSYQVSLKIDHRLAVSFEEQPAGLMAHFSISLDRPGRMPHPLAVQVILEAAGFDIDPVNPPSDVGCWVEEFLIDGKPGGHAINFLFTVERRTVQ